MSLPKGWQPTYDERTARRLFQQYHGRGESLSKEQLEELERHSEAYGIPFYSGDFSLLEAVHQIGAGFVVSITVNAREKVTHPPKVRKSHTRREHRLHGRSY